MKRALFSLLGVVLIAGTVLSCSQAPAAPSKSAPAAAPASGEKLPERLVFFSLNPGTSIYATSVGLSQLVNQYTPLKTIVQPYASSKVRFENLAKGTVDISTATASSAYAYTYGESIDVEPGDKPPFPQARLLTGGNNLYFGWITRQDTGIKTIADLKGRKVSGMVPGQATLQVLTVDSLKAFGLDIEKDVQAVPFDSTNASSTALADGKIEASMNSLGGSKMEELEATKGVLVLPFPADKLSSMRVLPELIKVHTLPAKHVVGIKEPTPTIGTQNFLVARDDLPDEAAYLIVKAVLEHSQELIPVSVEFKEWGKEQALPADFFIPFHPGAIKYFKEQGMWTTALDARQKEMLDKVAKLGKS